MSLRPSKRAVDELRPIEFELGYPAHAEGACIVRFGNTHVMCTATVEEKLPPFLRDKKTGWITAEYGMLPRATDKRVDREASRGKQSGRTQEIQRLIGRSLRAITDLKALGERQVRIDCDVLQADGGTRTAAITGSYIALWQALQGLVKSGKIKELPLTDQVAAISCGIYKGTPVLDLDTPEHEAPEETGKTFEENALIKAKHAARNHKNWVLADDSGLEIEALDNQPGIYTGRWYYKAGGILQIAEKLKKDLLPFENRSARFVCVLCLYHPDTTYEFFQGHIDGKMVFPPRGNNVFGYDPIFQPAGHTRTFAQMSIEEKHALSHRANAIEQLIRAYKA